MSIKICIIGCGNISNTRHIPALKTLKNVVIEGIISDKQDRLDRTINNHKLSNVSQLLLKEGDVVEQLERCQWFKTEIDAVIIGTPPKQHFPLVKACLQLKKHVLVEKPMMMNVEECEEVMKIADDNKLVLNVMHSFSRAKGLMDLRKRYEAGELGKAQSILELQLSNRDRRLPVWYNDLPLGLFYDEAAHFFYSAYIFGGDLSVLNAHAVFNENDNTPRFLEAQMTAGKIPVQMFMNFNSPVCEWGFVLICDKKIAIYDYFKDILVVLKNDGQHYAKDILRNSVTSTLLFWKGFFMNGLKLVSGKLFYGHDTCIKQFVNAINTGESQYELSAELGYKVVKAMNEVVDFAKER